MPDLYTQDNTLNHPPTVKLRARRTGGGYPRAGPHRVLNARDRSSFFFSGGILVPIAFKNNGGMIPHLVLHSHVDLLRHLPASTLGCGAQSQDPLQFLSSFEYSFFLPVY